MPSQRGSSAHVRAIVSAVLVVMDIVGSPSSLLIRLSRLLLGSLFRSHELVVRGYRQELLHRVGRRERLEDLGRPVEPPGAPARVSNLLPDCRELFVAHLREQLAR